ncbi:MAG: hypothetical protein ACK4RW_01770 [Rehaibacterium terrae]|uniref:hypothetical protein n=1 Tax=Rehaibacterium terrae TaxID=1341696 RepID=UPI00391884DC
MLLAAALLFGAGVVAAEGPPTRQGDRDLPEAVRRAERETGGQVLRAERVRGGEVNRVKVLTPEGRVRVLHDDPRRARDDDNRRRRERDDGMDY